MVVSFSLRVRLWSPTQTLHSDVQWQSLLPSSEVRDTQTSSYLWTCQGQLTEAVWALTASTLVSLVTGWCGTSHVSQDGSDLLLQGGPGHVQVNTERWFGCCLCWILYWHSLERFFFLLFFFYRFNFSLYVKWFIFTFKPLHDDDEIILFLLGQEYPTPLQWFVAALLLPWHPAFTPTWWRSLLWGTWPGGVQCWQTWPGNIWPEPCLQLQCPRICQIIIRVSFKTKKNLELIEQTPITGCRGNFIWNTYIDRVNCCVL